MKTTSFKPIQASLFGLCLAFATALWADKPLAPENLPGTRLVSAEQVIELINTQPQLVILDSRRQEEYAKGHIEGAISLLDTDMTEDDLALHTSSKTTPLLFYCNGERCLRSSNAATRAAAWGYQQIYWFRGGWEEWMRKELPISH